ncbi:MAG TPA: hypothetical protein VFO60_06825 [Candidatus Dormibacteraeota bacterium]|nr:hypothetical protein [Candidatus Dormibacteraeota bacterium]
MIYVLLAVLVAVGIVIALLGYDRYRPQQRSAAAYPTHEVLVDPVTNQRQRVHVDPGTGERIYVDEPVPIPGSAVPPLARPGFLGTPPVEYPPDALPPGGGHVAPPRPVEYLPAPGGAQPPSAPGGPETPPRS